jgi:hypothetical protein
MRGSSAGTILFAVLLAIATTHAAVASNHAVDDGSEATREDIDLFDEDVELTPTGWSRLSIAAGVTYLDADGVLGARPPNRPPVTIIDFDRIGLDEDDASHWFTLTWRSSKSRWGAWFANWRYDVAGMRAWSQEFEIEPGVVIPVGAEVSSTFDADWYIGELTYSFLRSDRVDAGIGIGVHTVDLDTELAARVDVGDGSVEVIQGDLDTLAPLPNVLGYLYWEFLPRWNVVGRLGWFSLDYDIYSGQMTNAHLMLNYRLTERFSLGAAYQFVSLDVDIERKNYREIYDIDFAGPILFLKVRF